MERRRFLSHIGVGVAALLAAPSLVFASRRTVLYGDGVHDDSEALQAWLDGKDVFDASGCQIPAGNDRVRKNCGIWYDYRKSEQFFASVTSRTYHYPTEHRISG